MTISLIFPKQVAQQEMLRNKQRIIPIIFREFDNKNLDENLKVILSTITYLIWPTEERERKKFWKRLIKAMPKQKARRTRETAM